MDDLISRQAAIDTLSVGRELLNRVLDETDVVGTEREKFSFWLGLIESAIKDIEELPSVESEQKIGYWIPVHPLQTDDEGAYLCSNCNTGDWDIKPEDKYYKFCGAKMLGVKKV